MLPAGSEPRTIIYEMPMQSMHALSTLDQAPVHRVTPVLYTTLGTIFIRDCSIPTCVQKSCSVVLFDFACRGRICCVSVKLVCREASDWYRRLTAKYKSL